MQSPQLVVRPAHDGLLSHHSSSLRHCYPGPSRSRAIAALVVSLLLVAAGPALAQTGLQFNGSNQYVTFGPAPSLGASTFTLECWFYRTGAGATASTGTGGVTAVPLLTKGRGEADGDNRDCNYFLGIRGSDNVLCADFEDTATGGNHPVAGVTAIQNNTWYHAAVTYDGTTWQVFLNGQLETTLAANATPRFDSIQHTGIATAMTSTGATAGFFAGIIDEPRIWNVARTQTEIQADMLQEVTLGTGLIGRWGLNEGSGTSAGNSVPGGVNGTLTNGPSWVAGLLPPSALQLGSSNAYVTFGNAAALGLPQFTLECWFKRNGAGVSTTTGSGGISNAIPLVTKGRGEGDGSNVDMNYFFGIDNATGTLAADFEEGATGSSPGLNHPIFGATPVTSGVWHHAAATYDGTAWRLYLDGILDAELAVGQPPRSDSIQHSALGSALTSAGTPAGYFDGTLDEVRIWNYARSATQIQADINVEMTTPQSGLVERWGLDEISGSSVPGTVVPIAGTITGTGARWAASAPFNLSFTPPAAPTSLTATAPTWAQVDLQWTDNSTDETNFEIERSTTGAGGPFTLLTTVPANTTTYGDAAVSPGAEYCYQVRAVNGAGASAFTNVDCATTPAEGDYALDLGTGSAYVTFGRALPTLGLSQFTLECWFRRDGAGSTANTGGGGFLAVPLVTKGVGEAEESNVDMNYFLGIHGATGTLAADFEEGPGGAGPLGLNHPVIGTTVIATGVWYHAAATYDGTTWRLYLNGHLDGEVAVGQPPRSDSIQHAALGAALNSTGAASGHLDGALDEVRIWDFARTETEIRNDINAQITTAQSGLVARWGLNEGAGTVVHANAGTTVNGTILNSGSSWFTPGAPFDLSFDPPDAPPSNLVATAVASDEIDLTWTDGSTNESGFEIERSTDGGSTFALLTTVPANTESYADPGLSPLTEYCYQVRAVNANGASAYTNQDCAATPDADFALDLGSGNAYVTFGSALPTLGLSQFTLECWFRRDGTGTAASTGTGGVTAIPLVTKGRGEADGDNRDMNYFFGIDGASAVLVADFEEGSGGASPGLNHPVAGMTPIVTGQWYHAAVTYDGTTWRLYLNGNLDGTLAVGQPPRSDSIQHAALGSALTSAGAASGYFDGVLDEVRIWNFARAETEIQTTINSEIPGSQTGLVARWGLNEGTGSTVGSTAGTTVDGTILNSGYSWLSPGAPFDITFDPPDAPPSNLTATAVAFNEIDLAWVDASTNESGFEIERSTDGGTTFEWLTTVAANSESYADFAVDPLTEYCYQVRAVNGNGASTYTNQACDTTPDIGNIGLGFGGTNAYVTFGPTSTLGLPEFTLECWFRRNGAGVTTNTGTGGVLAVPLVTKGRGESENSNVDMNYFLGIRGTDGVLCADFEEGAGGASPGLNHPVIGTTPVTTGVWHHAAATYDGTTWRLYLDGAQEAELAVGQPPRSDSIQHAALGGALNSTGVPEGYFDGVLDEVRIWNVARITGEIQNTINLEITGSAPGLVARWGLNEGMGTTVSSSAGTTIDGTIIGSTWVWTAGAPLDANLPPAIPVLNAPAHMATGVPLSPTLDVTVTDPEDDPLTVTFFGRPRVTTAAPDFTVVFLPDTQNYTAQQNGGSNAMFKAQTEWVIANRETRNIALAHQLGDCAEHGDNNGDPIEWMRADTSMTILEQVSASQPDGVPYGICVGNHDQSPNGDADGTTTFYNQYFGESRFTGRAYYGGHYGANNDNHYSLFSASGMDFILVSLEYDTSPDAAVLAWADGLLTTYSDRRAIVASHYLIGTGNPGSFGTQGQAIYDALKAHPNLFLMVCGHVPGEGRRTDTYNGSMAHTLLSDYQNRTGGGSGWLRILEFRPSLDQIAVFTYSPWLNQFEADADSSSQFILPYAMDPAPDWVMIGTPQVVASGGNATVEWAGLDPLTEYEWYATVSDGSRSRSSSIWTFTTGSSAVPAPVTDLAAAQVTTGNDADGTTTIALTFTVPPEAATVEVYRAPFGAYPEYDDGGGATPAVPSYPPGAPWVLTAVNSSGQADDPPARDVWHYVVFTKNASGGTSAVSNMTAGTLNYHLGDVSDGATAGQGDNSVDMPDVSLLGDHYFASLEPDDPFNYLDVGPTTDYSVHGRPTTDNVLNFEDLMMCAINYGEVGLTAPAAPEETPVARPDLVLRTEATADGLLARIFLEAHAGNVKGIRARLDIDPGLALVQVEMGDLLAEQGEPVVFHPLPAPLAGIDAAVLGQSSAIVGSGEVARIRLRGHGDVRLAVADLRDLHNRFLGDEPQQAGMGEPLAVPLPTRFDLLAAQPNPFNPSTTLRFLLPEAAMVSLRIYDVSGQLVRALVEGDFAPGEHAAVWDGRNGRGGTVGSGVYLVRLTAGRHEFTQKIQLVK